MTRNHDCMIYASKYSFCLGFKGQHSSLKPFSCRKEFLYQTGYRMYRHPHLWQAAWSVSSDSFPFRSNSAARPTFT